MKKQLDGTWVEVNNKVHIFVVHNQNYPQLIEI
jgi:hypothetical protein